MVDYTSGITLPCQLSYKFETTFSRVETCIVISIELSLKNCFYFEFANSKILYFIYLVTLASSILNPQRLAYEKEYTSPRPILKASDLR